MTSLGIALPDGYGMHWVDGRKNIDSLDETGNNIALNSSLRLIACLY